MRCTCSLAAPPRAAYRLLDRLRGVREARHAGEAGGEQHRAPGLPDRERRAHVLPEEEVLDGEGRRPVLRDQVADAAVDAGQPPFQRLVGAGADHAAVERGERLPARDHHAEAGVGGAGIDAEDDHHAE